MNSQLWGTESLPETTPWHHFQRAPRDLLKVQVDFSLRGGLLRRLADFFAEPGCHWTVAAAKLPVVCIATCCSFREAFDKVPGPKILIYQQLLSANLNEISWAVFGYDSNAFSNSKA